MNEIVQPLSLFVVNENGEIRLNPDHPDYFTLGGSINSNIAEFIEWLM